MLMRFLHCRFILHKTIYHIFIFYNTTLSCDKIGVQLSISYLSLIFLINAKKCLGGIFRSPVGPRSFHFLKIDRSSVVIKTKHEDIRLNNYYTLVDDNFYKI